MIHQNLTPFHWVPKVTSRQGRQVEMAVCVRAVFVLDPDKPLEAIEDPMEQGFMSSELYADDDLDREGALVYGGDMADWKMNAEVLVKGHCHPPEGPTKECDVSVAVGGWSKRLCVTGPRVFKPGLLMGGRASEPELFESMPLTWDNAYGGEGYAENPVGCGYKGERLPAVTYPGEPIKKPGGKGVRPASFGAISPGWAPRRGKMGKNYGAEWRRTRAPFVSEDFDWTFHHSAPADQQFEGYLRGDEMVLFENMHPQAARLEKQLPGIRIRALVKSAVDGVIHEATMRLDTLYADLDDGKLSLTWRGLVPIRETDMTDVGVVLIAQENLADEPKPREEYVAMLEEFEADPVGLEAKMPPGFMMFANAVAAVELAELNDEPLPDLSGLAENLPEGCPFPSWFVDAVAGADDPLGIEAQVADAQLTGPDPLGLEAMAGPGVDPDKLNAAVEEIKKVQTDPNAALGALEAAVGLVPPDKQSTFAANVASLQRDLAVGTPAAQSLDGVSAPATPTPAKPAAQSYTDALGEVGSGFDSSGQAAPDGSVVADGKAAFDAQAPKSLDDPIAEALAPLDEIELPDPAELPDVEAMLAEQRADLIAKEAAMRAQLGDDPMLGLFALGHRMIDAAPRLSDVMPDLTPFLDGLRRAQDALLGQGISLAAIAPLTGLITRLETIQAVVPEQAEAPPGEFVQADLRNLSFDGQDLAGADFTRADLTGSTFRNANLSGATFHRATLDGVDLTGAALDDAWLTACSANKLVAPEIRAPRSNWSDADITGANLSGADLTQARLEQTRGEKVDLSGSKLVGADWRFSNISKSDLRGCDLTGADLSIATWMLIKGDGIVLRGAKLDMTKLMKSRLRGANMIETESDMAAFHESDLTGADFRRCRYHKVDMMKARLDKAVFAGAVLRQTTLRDVHAHEAKFDLSDIGMSSATGEADFAGATFLETRGERTVWMDVTMTGADLRHAHFENAFFHGTKGEDVDFAASYLGSASFRRAQLVRPRFSQADLCRADFTESRLDDANFRGANCYAAVFLGARATRSDFEDANLDAVQVDDGQRQPGDTSGEERTQ